MNALKLLERQHREVDELFEEFENTTEDARDEKERLCREISDALAIHAEIEEKIFYPEAREASAALDEPLRESVEEHLSVKRLVADIIEKGVDDANFEARMKVLKEQVEHHVEEEEKELFPRVRKACDAETLDDMGERMEELADQLEAEGEPSAKVPGQTDEPAPI